MVNLENMNTDVIVTFESGDKYVASFITYKRLLDLIEENKKSGSYLSGGYFWMKNMVLVKDMSEAKIKSLIDHLVGHGDFQLIFEKM